MKIVAMLFEKKLIYDVEQLVDGNDSNRSQFGEYW
jgi:hypothetical protein